jgi:hypothetical protein
MIKSEYDEKVLARFLQLTADTFIFHTCLSRKYQENVESNIINPFKDYWGVTPWIN